MIRIHDVLLLSATLASAAARLSGDASSPPRAHELDASYTFSQYLAHFSKSYSDADEYARRSEIFSANLRKILAHNEGRMDDEGNLIQGGHAMGVNAFTDFEDGEIPMGYNKMLHPAWRSQLSGGRHGDVVTATERKLGEGEGEGEGEVVTSYEVSPDFVMEEVSSLPESIDWSAEGVVNQAPNQGMCGSCWSFAATAAVESHLAIATGEKPPPRLSEQEMMVCTANPEHCGGTGQCEGSTVEIGLNRIADNTAKGTGGMYRLEDVSYSPYSSSRPRQDCEAMTRDKSAVVGITGWTQLESNSYKAVMNALAKKGPLAVGVAAGSWPTYSRGVLDTADTTVNHAVLLIGYGVDEGTGEKFWKVRNSWGAGWGEGGYIRIKRSDDDDDVCGMDTNPGEGMACALDGAGRSVVMKPQRVCGTGAILFDAVYATGVHKIE